MKSYKFKFVILASLILFSLIHIPYVYTQKQGSLGDPVIIRIIKLDYADAEQLAFTLEPFLSPQGRITAYTPTNSLIIRDRQSIVEELVRVIKGKTDH